MHGKQTLQKTLRNQQSAIHNASYKKTDYLEIGNWRFEENPEGDLIIKNLETQKIVTLIKK